MAVIELHELSKWYGEVVGLNGVSAAVGAGVTGLVGPNGAGKSTLMGLATGQLKPSRGSIRVFGERSWNRPGVLSRIGYCPEGDPFWYNLTGRQFVTTLAKISGLGGAKRWQAVDEALEQTGATKYASRPIRTYSKGMRQRIKVAQALVHKPELLVLDEPFTGADPVGRHDLAQLFRRLAAEGVTILISSHVLHEVEALTRQIMMINRGRIVAEGSLHEVRRRMHNRPHAIRIRLDDPRALARSLAAMDAVTGLKLTDGDTLLVETLRPDEVYDRLPELAATDGQVVREVAAADESLEALFGYLTERGGGSA